MSRTIGIALVGVLAFGAAGPADANGRGATGPVIRVGGAVHAAAPRRTADAPARFGYGGGRPAAPGAGAYAWGMRPLPGVSGTIHERAGRSPYFTGIGHLDAAWRPDGGTGLRRAYGGYDGARRFRRAAPGFERARPGLAHDRRFYASGYGPGAGTYRGYGRYGYGGGFAGGAASEAAGPGTQPGFAEAPLASAYAEAPLGPSPYAGYPVYSGVATQATAWDGYGGGPRIIVIDSGAGRPADGCACRAERPGPMVYRYGIDAAY